jgi:hypothetical protein
VFGQVVKVGGPDDGVAGAPHDMFVVLVRNDEDDVRLIGRHGDLVGNDLTRSGFVTSLTASALNLIQYAGIANVSKE